MLKRWRRIARDDRLWHLAALVSLMIFAIYLRFVNLAWNPGWYPDEGSDLNIARNLAEGRLQYFALGGTPLIAARVPLFHLMLTGAFTLWGYDILAARLVVAIFNVLTIVLLYWATRQMFNRRMALLAALMLTIIPNVLLYQRIAFAYNVQAFFYVLGWWALWKFSVARRARWLVIAVLMASAAYMTALTGLGLVISVLLIIGWYTPRHLGWGIALMALPGIAYLSILFSLAPNALLEDFALLGERSGGGSILLQVFDLIWNYILWLDWMVWIGVGIAGLFLLEERRVRVVTMTVFFVTMINAMRMLPGDLSFHRYLELLPFIALGAANFILCAHRFLTARIRSDLEAATRFLAISRSTIFSKALIALVIGGLLYAPLFWLGAWNNYSISSRELPHATRLDVVLVRPSDAVAVTDYVNQQSQVDDLVLASPAIAWRLKTRVADFEQMLAFDGKRSQNYGKGVARTRFVFAPSLERATYVVVDNMWRVWATKHMPDLKDYIQTVESWPRVLRQGDFEVYQNPKR